MLDNKRLPKSSSIKILPNSSYHKNSNSTNSFLFPVKSQTNWNPTKTVRLQSKQWMVGQVQETISHRIASRTCTQIFA